MRPETLIMGQRDPKSAIGLMEKLSAENPRAATARAQEMNARFFDQSRDPSFIHKMSSDSDRRLADYLRERSVFNQIMPQEDVSYSDLEQGYQTDTPLYRIYLSQETTAFLGTFEGGRQQVTEQYFPRIFMAFLLLRTGTMTVNEYNAATYPFPVVPALEERQGIDLEEAVDLLAFRDIESAMQVQRNTWNNIIRGRLAAEEIALTGTNSGNEFRFTPNDLTALKRYFATKRSGPPKVILMPEPNYLDLEDVDLDEVGDAILTRFFDSGVTQDEVRGCKIIRTIKCDTAQGDTFRSGNIYAFSDPAMIGRNKRLRAPRMFVERKRNDVSFDTEAVFGWIIAAPSRIAKIETYNGGVAANVPRSREFPAEESTLIEALVENVTPASDTMFDAPEQVLGKDYLKLEDEAMRPFFRAVGA